MKSKEIPGILSLLTCLKVCQEDHHRGPSSGFGTTTKVRNQSDRAVEVQIRVGSVLKKVHTLKPGCSKRLKSKSIYKAYMPNCDEKQIRRVLYYYDETCMPYVWIHDSGGSFSRMVKQQYISLDDLRECSEIRIFRDHQRGSLAVRKKPRPEFCA